MCSIWRLILHHTIEQLIKKINLMHDIAIDLHRERNKFSKLTDQKYDKIRCQYLLDQIQALAGDIYNDRQGSEIKTEMEYKDGKGPD